MKFKDLVRNISTEFNKPADEAKEIGIFVLSQLAGLIEKKEDLKSPYISIKIREKLERKVTDKKTGEQKVIQAKTVGIMTIKRK